MRCALSTTVLKIYTLVLKKASTTITLVTKLVLMMISIVYIIIMVIKSVI